MALQKGITVLSSWEHPLRTEDDVVLVRVGKKTRDKIVEIMETGHLERNAVRAADPTWQVPTVSMAAGSPTLQMGA